MVFNIQQSYIWQTILYFLSWLYLVLIFFEPANRLDKQGLEDLRSYVWLMETAEVIILTCFLGDTAMTIFHKFSDNTHSVYKKFLGSPKFLSNFLVNMALLVDFIIFYSSYPDPVLRFARILRPSNTSICQLVLMLNDS